MSEEVQNEGSTKPAPPEQELAPVVAPSPPDFLDASINVSQTSIGQMTASSAPADEGSKWCCEVCTYENFPLSRKCTMCRSAKPALNEDIFKLQDGASALPTPAQLPPTDLCGAEAVTERLKPLRISSPQGAASASSVTKWPCPTCTYDNWPKAQKCAMCGSVNAAPHTSPSPPTGINDICNSQIASIHELEASSRRSKRRTTTATTNTNNNNNNTDWLWLQACLGVVEGDARRVDAYLSRGGDAARALTPHEVELLDRASAFDAGHTLVHLAIRFQRQDILSTLLSRISGGGPGLKRSPSYIAADLASAIRRHIAACVRYKKGGFPCRYIDEFCTFYLPAEIEELPAPIQEQLFSELLDRDAQQTLEADPPLINWSIELTMRLGSRLYALWNRSAGDCLPDAVCQAAYGVSDRHNTLRAALAESLHAARGALYARWSACERAQAARLHYAPDESQLRGEWARLCASAARPGAALAQVHVWALAHVLRRPIVVYGEDVVHSHRGDALGYAHFRGLYLPLMCDTQDPHAPPPGRASPLALAYTRGHFSALAPLPAPGAACAYLPLTDCDGKPLPVHFLTCDEMADEHAVVRRWLCAVVTAGGVLAARQTLHARPLLQAQMLEEWLNHYRRLAQQTRGPFPPRLQAAGAEFSSDGDTDEE